MERCSPPGAPRKPDGDEPVRSPKNTSVNIHSIINYGLIPGGQSSSKRQTVFFLPVDPMDKSHKDPNEIDLNVPRHAQYLHNAWKRHQDAVYWVDINLAIKKGLTFCQTRSNAIILHETLPACCVPKVFRMETGEVIYEKVYATPRPPPNISLKHDWKRELGSEDAQRQFKSFQSNQPIPNRKVQEKRPVLRRSMRVLFMKKLSKKTEWGNPLLKQEEPKRVHLMTGRASTLKIKQTMIERGNPLLKHTQKMCQKVPKHVLVMKAQASSLETKQFVIERGNPL